ncbi:MAG: ribosomal RNA small subunit methyltransferase A [Bacteroidetes bacterium]|nr:ribosomal RNA small subunit methyltransferase A [Bacteroidota bacterium]
MGHEKKKQFGQHFLKNAGDAQRVADALQGWGDSYNQLLEIGPGEGRLTDFLVERVSAHQQLELIEVDDDLINLLNDKYGARGVRVHHGDVLKYPFGETDQCGVIGNFPYNISSQIVFAILENRHLVQEMVGMFQKEVAQRIVADSGTKVYGILSVLTDAYYKRQPIFTLKPGAFHPPPKVNSMVIRLERYRYEIPDIDNNLFFRVVKQAFGQRRKTLRNSLKVYLNENSINALGETILQRRAEQLNHQEFSLITKVIQEHWQ